MSADFLSPPGLIGHAGFFTRRGGVSQGPYASLNCGLSGGDSLDHVTRNRALVAEALGADPGRLMGLTQVHGNDVIRVTRPWLAGAGPKADAMVTAERGIALGIITADCAPVLLWDAARNIAGAVHAGWRGAAAGVIEATIDAMRQLGSDPDGIEASVGPCIAQASYEVGGDVHNAVVPTLPEAARFFVPGARAGHWQFDLAGYCLARLSNTGVRGTSMGLDTCADEPRFFSHRRRTLAGGGPIGHQISVIRTHD